MIMKNNQTTIDTDNKEFKLKDSWVDSNSSSRYSYVRGYQNTYG